MKKVILQLVSPLKNNTAFAVLFFALLICAGFFYIQVYRDNVSLKKEISELQASLKNTNDSLAQVQAEKKSLMDALQAAADKNAAFASQLSDVTSNLDRMRWINSLDPQLLQKYSKVYFLNENYTPTSLSLIDTKYIYDKNKAFNIEIQDRVLPFLQQMMKDSLDASTTIKVVSAYRSFGTQASLKSGYKVTYGSGANAFSADQGYSEHQLGTTLDFTTPAIGGGLTGFDKTTAYTWLTNNAYRYGFVLSYPKNNAYYVYEPWHWRFVGIELATKLHNENKNFYDLDQREINTYLANMFNSPF